MLFSGFCELVKPIPLSVIEIDRFLFVTSLDNITSVACACLRILLRASCIILKTLIFSSAAKYSSNENRLLIIFRLEAHLILYIIDSIASDSPSSSNSDGCNKWEISLTS